MLENECVELRALQKSLVAENYSKFINSTDSLQKVWPNKRYSTYLTWNLVYSQSLWNFEWVEQNADYSPNWPIAINQNHKNILNSKYTAYKLTGVHCLLRGLGPSSTKIGTIQRRLALPLRKDDNLNLRWIRSLLLAIFLLLLHSYKYYIL